MNLWEVKYMFPMSHNLWAVQLWLKTQARLQNPRTQPLQIAASSLQPWTAALGLSPCCLLRPSWAPFGLPLNTDISRVPSLAPEVLSPSPQLQLLGTGTKIYLPSQSTDWSLQMVYCLLHRCLRFNTLSSYFCSHWVFVCLSCALWSPQCLILGLAHGKCSLSNYKINSCNFPWPQFPRLENDRARAGGRKCVTPCKLCPLINGL